MGRSIKLYKVNKWNRATVADGKMLNFNTIEPLSANDFILASAISGYKDEIEEYKENEYPVVTEDISADITKWNGTYNTVNSLSAAWKTAYNYVSQNSAARNADYDYTKVNAPIYNDMYRSARSGYEASAWLLNNKLEMHLNTEQLVWAGESGHNAAENWSMGLDGGVKGKTGVENNQSFNDHIVTIKDYSMGVRDCLSDYKTKNYTFNYTNKAQLGVENEKVLGATVHANNIEAQRSVYFGGYVESTGIDENSLIYSFPDACGNKNSIIHPLGGGNHKDNENIIMFAPANLRENSNSVLFFKGQNVHNSLCVKGWVQESRKGGITPGQYYWAYYGSTDNRTQFSAYNESIPIDKEFNNTLFNDIGQGARYFTMSAHESLINSYYGQNFNGDIGKMPKNSIMNLSRWNNWTPSFESIVVMGERNYGAELPQSTQSVVTSLRTFQNTSVKSHCFVKECGGFRGVETLTNNAGNFSNNVVTSVDSCMVNCSSFSETHIQNTLLGNSHNFGNYNDTTTPNSLIYNVNSLRFVEIKNSIVNNVTNDEPSISLNLFAENSCVINEHTSSSNKLTSRYSLIFGKNDITHEYADDYLIRVSGTQPKTTEHQFNCSLWIGDNNHFHLNKFENTVDTSLDSVNWKRYNMIVGNNNELTNIYDTIVIGKNNVYQNTWYYHNSETNESGDGGIQRGIIILGNNNKIKMSDKRTDEHSNPAHKMIIIGNEFDNSQFIKAQQGFMLFGHNLKLTNNAHMNNLMDFIFDAHDINSYNVNLFGGGDYPKHPFILAKADGPYFVAFKGKCKKNASYTGNVNTRMFFRNKNNEWINIIDRRKCV